MFDAMWLIENFQTLSHSQSLRVFVWTNRSSIKNYSAWQLKDGEVEKTGEGVRIEMKRSASLLT